MNELPRIGGTPAGAQNKDVATVQRKINLANMALSAANCYKEAGNESESKKYFNKAALYYVQVLELMGKED